MKHETYLGEHNGVPVYEVDIVQYKNMVEWYINRKTGRVVKIVFDNPMMMHRHFKLLCEAYDIANAYYKNTK